MSAPEGRKKLAWLGVYFLWMVLDVESTWSVSHLLCISLGAIGTCGLWFAEINSVRLAAGLSSITLFIGVILYLFVPPPAPDTGWLQAADEPTPPNGCDHLPPDAPAVGTHLLTLFGDNGILALNDNQPYNVLTVGECPMVQVSRGPNGVLFSAQINDEMGGSLGVISNNKFNVSNNSGLTIEKMSDLSGLVVHNREGKELFFARVLNSHTVRVRGIFSCGRPRPTTAEITNTTVSNSMWSSNCFIGGSGGVRVQ